MLRSCIQDIGNQSYQNIFHAINITHNGNIDEKTTLKTIDDLKTENNSFIFDINQHQHINHLKAIKSVSNYESYDIFVKIDDDDIYKKNYIENIVNFFEHNDVDVISSKIKYQLNGSLVRVFEADNLGGNPNNCDFKMPPTFAFNLKALKQIETLTNIFGFEDNMWRDVWCKTCKIGQIDNTENIVWHIHGKNISTSDFLLKN
jgi:hypothetical protein